MTTPDPQRVELKPCPFCGRAVTMGHAKDAYVECQCGAEGPYFNRDDPEAKLRAAEAWNTRALSAADAVQPTRRDKVLRELEQIAVFFEERVSILKSIADTAPPATAAADFMVYLEAKGTARNVREMVQAALATTTDAAGGGS